MLYVDLHCDTASRLFYEKELELKSSICSVDIEKLKKGNALMQMFAFFIDLNEIKRAPFEEFSLMYENFKKELYKNKNDIEIFNNNIDLNKLYACLTIEEGEVLEGNPYNVEKISDMGIKFLTLTWNYENSIGYPNYNFTYKDKGLKNTGFEIVEELEKFNIIPDCSHLSDRGFYDLVEKCKKPFVATHSNSRKIKNNPRNMTDDMIKLLASKGGVMGINFYNEFVQDGEKTTIDGIIKHIKHIKNVGGIDVIALGSDFDGIDNEIEINNSSEMFKLIERLEKEGFKIGEIEKIFYKNALRVIGN